MNILFIDLGNTNITIGIGNEDAKLLQYLKFPNSDLNAFNFFIKGKKIKKVVIASVVPKLTSKLIKILKTHFNTIEVILVPKDIEVPLENKYKVPQSLGIDRLLNAFYVKEKIGIPAICIDVGTAITMDLISEKAEFLGGLIFPGIRICFSALAEKTALLPCLFERYAKIELIKTGRVYGTTTEECMSIGVLMGISNLIERVTKKFEKLFPIKPYKVISGGDARLIKSMTNKEYLHIPNLTLKALVLLYLKFSKKIQK